MNQQPQPFRIDIADAVLERIAARVRAYDWSAVPDAGGWSAGTSLADLQRLTRYWLDRYDWRATERRLNQVDQYRVEIDGQPIHFLHARSAGAGATPLLMLHGWPSTVFEFLDLIGPLTAPGDHGAPDAPAFEIIAPSLPGYGFSTLSSLTSPRRTARTFASLMERLGHARYFVQGGDWGNVVAGWMGYDRPDACLGLHLNMVSTHAADAVPETPEEIDHARRRAEADLREGGYSKIQGTKPQSLALAMVDSPVGTAAWIVEKFAGWSDLPRDEAGNPDLWARYSEDELLTCVMIYLVTNSFPTSIWMYKGRLDHDTPTFPAGSRIAVPTAVAAFRDPVFPPPPRSFIEKTYDVVQWTDMPAGGHFPALEQPQLLVDDIRRFRAGLSAT